MRMTITKRLLAAGCLVLAAAGCGDLTVEPKSTITSGNIFDDPASYKAFLAKLYAGLATTGQSGPDGSADIGGIDEGFSQYLRGYWQLQQLPTDESIIGWGDTGLPELNTQTWSATNPFIHGMYSRIFYQVALANQFLRETSPDKLASRGVTADLRTQVTGYRAEARFLRALSYYHAADLFGNVPLVDETFNLGALPRQAPRTEVVAFVESELRAIRAELPITSRGDQYGRASQGAVDMVLAKLLLNAEVYTGTARWADARVAAEAAIAGQYSLDPNFMRLFSIDNSSSQEIIFAVPFDGNRTRTWGGMTYLVHAMVGGDMNAANYGIDGGWWGLRIRPEAVDRYEGGVGGPDRRTSYFFTTNQTKTINNTSDFKQGYAAPKFRNVSTSGQAGSNQTHPDLDYPMFRLADAYLMYAEAVVRGGGGSRATALQYVNALRDRAYGSTAGRITDAQLTGDFILAERSRELLLEGFRRQDLIRFDRFSDNGTWTWKGNTQAGRTTESFRDLFPIPANELFANPTIVQNPGY